MRVCALAEQPLVPFSTLAPRDPAALTQIGFQCYPLRRIFAGAFAPRLGAVTVCLCVRVWVCKYTYNMYFTCSQSTLRRIVDEEAQERRHSPSGRTDDDGCYERQSREHTGRGGEACTE